MSRLDPVALKRIANATLWVERQSAQKQNPQRRRGASHGAPFYGYTAERIDNGDSGLVTMAAGDVTTPSTGTIQRTVANPYVGDLITGHVVHVVPATMEAISGDIYWVVAPLPLIYEGRTTAIVAPGADDAVIDIYRSGSPVSEQLTAVHFTWVDGPDSIAAATNVRVAWDFLEQRFYIEAVVCE